MWSRSKGSLEISNENELLREGFTLLQIPQLQRLI
jgi:hypothetical protein